MNESNTGEEFATGDRHEDEEEIGWFDVHDGDGLDAVTVSIKRFPESVDVVDLTDVEPGRYKLVREAGGQR